METPELVRPPSPPGLSWDELISDFLAAPDDWNIQFGLPEPTPYQEEEEEQEDDAYINFAPPQPFIALDQVPNPNLILQQPLVAPDQGGHVNPQPFIAPPPGQEEFNALPLPPLYGGEHDVNQRFVLDQEFMELVDELFMVPGEDEDDVKESAASSLTF